MKVSVLQFNKERPIISHIKEGFRITFVGDVKEYLDYCSEAFGEGVVSEQTSKYVSKTRLVVKAKDWTLIYTTTKHCDPIVCIVVDSLQKLELLTSKFNYEYTIDAIPSIDDNVMSVLREHLFETATNSRIRKIQAAVAKVLKKQWYEIEYHNGFSFEHEGNQYSINL